MKLVKPFVAIIFTAVVVGCSAAEQEQGRETFRNVERGTGQVLENAGEIVGAGADALDQSWETPAEQRRARQLEGEDESEPLGTTN